MTNSAIKEIMFRSAECSSLRGLPARTHSNFYANGKPNQTIMPLLLFKFWGITLIVHITNNANY